VLNLNASLSSLILDGFNSQREQTTRMKGKLDDFLDNKITFELTPIKRQKLLDLATKDTPISIDSRFQPSSSTTFVSFVSSTKQTTSLPAIELQRSSSPSSPSYLLNRQVQTVIDLFKEWTIGLETSPFVASLNDQYDYAWRKG